MKSNLELFRECSKDHLSGDQIDSLQQFKQLANHLCDNKLLHPEQVKQLQHKLSSSKDMKFPISLQQLEQFIMTEFGDRNLMEMLQSFKQLKGKLRQTKGVLNIWKDKGLSKKERYELESIFEQGNSQMQEVFRSMEKEKDIIEQIYEQEQQMIDALDEWVKMQKIEQPFKDHLEYQAFHLKLIEQQFSRLRVREVHFRHKVNTAKMAKIETAVGMDSRNDEPIQVTFLPKRMLDFQSMNCQLLTFNACKQLMLSSHFNRFLGYNTHSDPNCFLYFSQHRSTKNLQTYISNAKIELEEETPLFKYWASMLFQAFYDLYLMCSHVAELPIVLGDVEVGNCGLKLVVAKVRFSGYRGSAEGEFYEAELLRNLGQLMLGLLKIQEKDWGKQTKVKRIENMNIINCLLNARVGHKNHREKRVKSCMGFFNAQTHPLFESPSLTMGETIVSNYEAILNYN